MSQIPDHLPENLDTETTEEGVFKNATGRKALTKDELGQFALTVLGLSNLADLIGRHTGLAALIFTNSATMTHDKAEFLLALRAAFIGAARFVEKHTECLPKDLPPVGGLSPLSGEEEDSDE